MQKKMLFFLCIAFSFFLLLVHPLNASAEKSGKTEKVTSLGKIPEGYNIISNSIKFSPDLRHVTYAAYKNAAQKVVRYDDRTSPVYNAIQQGTPIFSPSNRHAYIAYERQQGDATVVVDWKPDPAYGSVDHFIFSPDGQRYAYRAGKGNKQCVVVDGRNGKWHRGILVMNNFLFSPDSNHLAYVAYDGKACKFVQDGKEQEHEFEFVKDVTFSPDSGSVAYKGRIGKTDNQETWCVVHNGVKQNPYRSIFSLIFSPDSRHLAYVAVKGDKMVLVVDGEEKEIREHYGLPVFSPNSKSMAYSYREGKNFHVYIDGKKGPGFPTIYKFYYSIDSSRFAYIAGGESRWRCIVDGTAGPEYKLIDVFQFSPDSSRFAYCGVTSDGKGTVILDGKPQQAGHSVGEPYFSPDSRHIAYKQQKEKDGKWMTILDGKETGQFYESIGKYHFSSDSKHLAYKAQVAAGKAVMVVDGREQCADREFALLDEPFFSPEGEYVAYLAADAKTNKYCLVVNGHVLPGDYGGFFLGTPIVFSTANRFNTLGMREPGPEFLLIEVEIPETLKLETELKKL